MYAVIETGGKQYRVEVGTELEVELLEAAPGDSITLDRVLLVADGDESAIGRPVVADAAVEAEVVRRDRGDKVISFKYRPKARRRVKKGHRQELTVLRITDVRLNGKSAAEDKRKADAAAKSERERLQEAAAKQAAEDAALAERLAKASAAKAPAKASATRGAKSSGKAEGATKASRSTADRAAGKPAAARAEPKTPRAKTQSGAADAKPKTTPSKPAAKPRTTKKED
ncbi:MAG TPA: 50S ribosomal protein L21 [Candidatus Limnocylindrales bacterium]|jgi:large subunit ribosomal protein L21